MSFGGIADDYDKFRPEPPAIALDWLLPAHCEVAVDLGAGTGLMTRALAARASHVIAVEPDDRMRSVLAARSPQVEVLAGRGEDIPLPTASADALIVSSAWHWMDHERAVPEIGRVLRDQGRLGVIWTGRDRGTSWLHADEWFADAHAETTDPREDAEPARGEHRDIALLDPGLFGNIETEVFRFTRSMDMPDLVEWLTTYSRVIMASDTAKDLGRARASAALAERFPGESRIDIPMRSLCWRADRNPR